MDSLSSKGSEAREFIRVRFTEITEDEIRIVGNTLFRDDLTSEEKMQRLREEFEENNKNGKTRQKRHHKISR